MKRPKITDAELERRFRDFRAELKKHNPYKGMTTQEILDKIRGR